MPGLKLTLPVAFTNNSNLPRFTDDPIIVPGSLWLYDARASFPSGAVPANGERLHNLAWSEAAEVLGAGTADTLASTLERQDGASMTLERSGKGGLHVILDKRTTAVPQGVGVVLEAASPIRQHLIDNPGHSYYFDAWHKVTRGPTGNLDGAARSYLIGRRDTPSGWANAFMMVTYNNADGRTAGYFYTAGGRTGLPDLVRAGDISTTNPHDGRVSAGISAKASAPYWGTSSSGNNTPGTPTLASQIILGAIAGRREALTDNPTRHGSRILYRMYFEDLTISGRTAADVEAQEIDLFNEAFGPGGDFAGDTYTEPSTVYPYP